MPLINTYWHCILINDILSESHLHELFILEHIILRK